MKTRYFFSFAVLALLTYVLGLGCTQDFGAFQACSFGQKICGNACVSAANPDFGCASEECLPCGIANAVNACDKGTCKRGPCTGTFEDCDTAPENGCEVDLGSDPQNCGACNTPCMSLHSQPACTKGECEVGTCDPGWGDCDAMVGTGCEVDLTTDAKHCGDCDTVCPQFQTCGASKCVLACEPGKGDCDNDPTNGCETDFGTDQNCAACGDSCDLLNATGSCMAGACAIVDCDNGFDDCDNMAVNGCEANIDSSTMTCGDCNTACPDGPDGSTTCAGGQCEITCDAGFGDCDGNLQNGCETDTNTSEQHCGDCGADCTIANGAGMCNGGTCTVTTCTAPFDDCNNMAVDGCETNTNQSAANCGGCGMDCTFPNAAGVCNGGACTMGACNAGFANCNGMAADGCEKATGNDPQNCGACGRVCNGTNTAALACAGGLCTSTCNAGFGNCSQPAAPTPDNGCETNTATNVDNCGGCGRACAGTAVASKSCTAGLCDSSCDPGFGNCNQPAAPGADNGCESNVQANNEACGGCGNSCSMQGGGNDLECDGGNGMQQTCGCDSAQECAGAGVFPGTSACQNATGLCQCSGSTCNVGESCIPSGLMAACACAGGAACSAGQACCQTPAGCFDLQTDPASCGACGHACAPDFVCNAGGCRCDADTDCNAGSGGAFSCNLGNGRCVCGATNCAAGERCLPNGQCG